MRKLMVFIASLVVALSVFPSLAIADEASSPDLIAYDPGPLSANSDPGNETELGAQASLKPTIASNAWGHDYFYNFATPSESFLHVNNNELERVQFTGTDLVVETVSSDYKSITSQKVIPTATYYPSNLVSGTSCLWGGFFSGASHNYVVTGQRNMEQDDNRVVFRITKYTKDWSYVANAEIRGANTTGPFDAGSCDMIEQNGVLHVRTCHEMYRSSDGRIHQANVQLTIDESNMTVTSQHTIVWNYSTGYVSHSFNQFLATLSGSVYGLDHGDAYPRAITIKKLGTSNNSIEVVKFPGEIGDNATGATAGGFESSSSTGKLLVVGSRTADESIDRSKPYNIWIAAIPSSLSTLTIRNVTSYSDTSAEGASNPFLVKVNENRFLVLWGILDSDKKHTGMIAYQFVDGNGNPLAPTKTVEGILSDCEPIVYKGKIVWYANDGELPVYYMIDPSTGAYSKYETLGSAKMEVEGTQYWWYDWHTGDYEKALPYDYARSCPETTLTLGRTKLVENTDYTLSYRIDHAKAQGIVTANGKGRFAGESRTVAFDIIPIDMNECIFSNVSNKTYTGSAITQDSATLTYYSSDEGFKEGVDYTVSYKNNVNAGTATYVVTGKGLLFGTIEGSFTINPASIEDATLSGIGNVTYDGAEHKPKPTLKIGNRTLAANTDYTVSYADYVNAGKATVTITGKGNYKGTRKETFEILKAKVSAVTLSKTSYAYDGKAKKPAASVTGSNGKTLVENTDYVLSYSGNTNVGTATVTAKGKGNYEGSANTTFKITAASIASATVTPSPSSFTYDGKEKKPSMKVVLNGTTLSPDTDYTVSYANNVNAGTATATITGKGNYASTVKPTFTIAQADISKAALSLSPANYTYDGKEKKPAVTVKHGSLLLSEGKDYTLTYQNNVAAGTATVTVTGKGNFKGTGSSRFAIDVNVKRLFGNTALDTMNAIVDEGGFAKGGTVVLTTAEGYWDALTAAGIAGMVNAPVLMTYKSSLSPQTAAELRKLAPKQIVVCGGPAAVPKEVADAAAKAAGNAKVVRCSGETATGTAVDIYKKAPSVTGGAWSKTAFVCTSDGYWDALAAAPVSYAKRMPIFLTEGKSSISANTLSAMKGNVKSVYIVGGPAAISPAVEKQLKDAGISIAGRLQGNTAIETSEAVASFGVDTMKMSANYMGVATMNGYWDALAGAALCGKRQSVLILVNGPLSHSIAGFASARAKSVSAAYVFGGPNAISDQTFSTFKTTVS